MAIVIFVRERGVSEIVEKARGALEAHPQCCVTNNGFVLFADPT